MKNISNKQNPKELKSFKTNILLKIKQKIGTKDACQIFVDSIEDKSASRRSSRLSKKKKNDCSEEIDNFNFYLLLEIINGSQSKTKSIPASNSKSSSIIGKILKENSKEEQKVCKGISNVFSSNSFGKDRKNSSKLQNKNLDIILNNYESKSDDSDKDSLDMNIGK